MKWEVLNLVDGAMSVQADNDEVAIIGKGKITNAVLEKLLNRVAEIEHQDDPVADESSNQDANIRFV